MSWLQPQHHTRVSRSTERGFRRRLSNLFRREHSRNDSVLQSCENTALSSRLVGSNGGTISAELNDVAAAQLVSDADQRNCVISAGVTANTGASSPHCVCGTPQDSDLPGSPPYDLWSVAFREAIREMGDDLDKAILQSQSIEHMFRRLEQDDEDKAEQSKVLRGMQHLNKAKVPLESFKQLLGLASTFAAAQPAAATVTGVLNGVTAIAITFASADCKFGEQIQKMLEHLPYIDGCDTLGEQMDRTNIHKALVSVYVKILEFYQAAAKILEKNSIKLVLKITLLQPNQLPDIVEAFLARAELLHKVVQDATRVVVVELRDMLYHNQIREWLGALKAERQTSYQAGREKLIADGTCDHLLHDLQFATWYSDPNHAELTIVGAIGTGKSIYAAFLVRELRRRSGLLFPRDVVCFHYCGIDETEEVNCMVSSLLLSLLNQLKGLQKGFHDSYKKMQETGVVEPSKDTKGLITLFQQVLAKIERRVFIVIDGLDECDRGARRDIVALMSGIARECPQTKYLLISQPNEELLKQPHIGRCIELHSSYARDLAIAEFTVQDQLDYLRPELKVKVVDYLVQRADGSAIWIKMAVEYLKLQGSRSEGHIKRDLSNTHLPQNFNELIDKLLHRQTLGNEENMVLARTALHVLAYARRALTLEELAWASALAVSPRSPGSIAALADEVDAEKLIDLIQPLVAKDILPGYTDRFSLRLAHSSIRNYARQWKIFTKNAQDRMLELCTSYLLLDPIGRNQLFRPEQLMLDEMPESDVFADGNEGVDAYTTECTWDEWERSMPRFDPEETGFGEFFAYASSHWVHHLAAVNAPDGSLLTTIEEICTAGSKRLENWTEQHRRPGCVVKPRFEFHSRLYDPLSIVCLYGSDAVLYYLIANSDFALSHYLPGSGLKAVSQVLQYGQLPKIGILVKCQNHRFQLPFQDFWEIILGYWSHPASRRRHEDWDTIFCLIGPMLCTSPPIESIEAVLHTAVKVNCLPLVQELATFIAEHENMSSDMHTSWPECARGTANALCT